MALLESIVFIKVLEKWVYPKIEDVLKQSTEGIIDIGVSKISGKYKTLIHKFVQNNFEEYLKRKCKKYIYIDTLVFPNKQTELKQLYEPLVIETEETLNDEARNWLINYFPDNLFNDYQKIILIDTAGMGKSTLMKYMFLKCIEEAKGFPILLELSRLHEENTIFQEILTQLRPLGGKDNEKLLYSLLTQGEFIIMLDGFDEISNANKAFVTKDLFDFIEKANKNKFIVTSRPEDSLTSFGEFKKVSITPLNKLKASRLLERYDVYNHKSIAKELILSLDKTENKGIEEFLENPLLTSLLYKAYDHKKEIPLKKSQFYDQVYNALFDAHDYSKEKHFKREKKSTLQKDEFDRVLRFIAFFTAKENEIEYERTQLIHIIEKAKKYISVLSFNSSDFLSDLLSTVPLFKREGLIFKWSHKSLQDYFAAKFIWMDTEDKQEKILEKIFHDSDAERFSNLLDIYSELNEKKFKQTLILWLLESYEKFFNQLDINDITYKKKVSGVLFSKKIKYRKHQDISIQQIQTEHKVNSATLIDLSTMLHNGVLVTMISTNNNKGVFLLEIINNKKYPFIHSNNTFVSGGRSSFLDEIRSSLNDLYFIDLPNHTHEFNQLHIDSLLKFFSISSSINHDKAIKELNKIKKEIKENKSDDLLDW